MLNIVSIEVLQACDTKSLIGRLPLGYLRSATARNVIGLVELGAQRLSLEWGDSTQLILFLASMAATKRQNAIRLIVDASGISWRLATV